MLVDRTRKVLIWMVTALMAAACGGGGGNPGATGPDARPFPAPAPVTASAAPLALALRPVVSGLDSPVFLASPAGDRRRFIVERAGRIRILRDGALLVPPFLDISANVNTAGEGGLLSMAFDPRYAANGQFFIYYTDAGGDIVVERRTASANPDRSDPTSALEILRIPHPRFSNHYGGLLEFGPDGLLYLGTGDGGGAGDPAGNAQNPGVLLGKMLRLDVGGATAGAPYAIPASNPFAGQAGRRAEIWATGLRNPWRFAFDGGSLYIADVGQDRREEVDVGAAASGGLNYGWNIREASLCYHADSCASAGLVAPAFEYDHGTGNANGCSIIGGYVYRGQALPELAGHYFYSDFCSGYLRSFLAAGTGVTEEKDWAIAPVNGAVSFGRDADGELYLMGANGTIYKIVRAGAPAG